MGDKEIPYSLLRKVMYTAARANYSDVSFAVSQKAVQRHERRHHFVSRQHPALGGLARTSALPRILNIAGGLRAAVHPAAVGPSPRSTALRRPRCRSAWPLVLERRETPPAPRRRPRPVTGEPQAKADTKPEGR